ncbi:Hypothetical protein, putative [Bodo saltans]|uniref:EGF-like domain-containing protein n=1 Tax=Bodo saltans TaxID=75058 RepID=A0A0S4JRG3_BODSA|nr:Hypothetical protein, putative [Bodo saltans]|eukprot:CUG92783.1 Hypothetical protein, putative [Bodo saltans]
MNVHKHGTKCEISNTCTSAVDCNNHAGRVAGSRPSCTCYCLGAYYGKTCNLTRTLTLSFTRTTLLHSYFQRSNLLVAAYRNAFQ